MKLGKILYRGTIVVDIDGVLADFESKFCEDFGTDNRHLYSLTARYPKIDPDIIKEYISNPDNYKDLSPIFGGLLFTRQAHGRGWNVVLMTSRSLSLKEVTANWLAKYGVVYNEIYFTNDKNNTIADYDLINPSKPVKIVVDDSVSVLKSVPNKYAVAWYQEWNSDYFPSMRYDNELMKIVIHHSKDDFYPVGAWDKVQNAK